jgi:hypothetical protein
MHYTVAHNRYFNNSIKIIAGLHVQLKVLQKPHSLHVHKFSQDSKELVAFATTPYASGHKTESDCVG